MVRWIICALFMLAAAVLFMFTGSASALLLLGASRVLPGAALLLAALSAGGVSVELRLPASVQKGQTARGALLVENPSIIPIVHLKLTLKVNNTQAIEPLGFLEFLQLEAGARLALTDSGGVQEEACILGVPCVTLRDNTERPETLDVGANLLAGADALRMVDRAKRIMQQGNGWKNPFGDGKASRLIIEALRT